MRETAVTFENQGLKLFGMIHLPDGDSKFPCVVFLHGYTGNRIGDHCLFVKAARDFCEHGIASLRFDFRGSGESEGKFSELTVEGEISDALVAYEFLSSLSQIDQKRVGLVGMSLGGCVAACISTKTLVRSLALWAPTAFVDYMVERGSKIIKDPYVWLPEDYQDVIKKRGHVDIGGYERGKPYFESVKNADPLREIARYDGPVLIMHGSEDQVVSPVNSEFLFDNVKGRRMLLVIDGADHTFSSAQWERKLIGTTRMWFQETL